MNDTSELKLSSRFTVRQRLGSGGMGVVYTAYDRQRDEDVALKILHTGDASALYRFKKEFRTLADVAHPNLVQLHELIVEDDQWFFTMEIVEGWSFFDFVRPRAQSDAATPQPTGGKLVGGELDLERLRRALRQLATGVQALHDAGKLHRDLKPSNVMVTHEGRLVILDFGLATELAPDRQSVDSGLAGTVAYMAPEQAKSEGASAASDWYAVGVIMFQALTGRLPFVGSLYDVLIGKQEKTAPSPADLKDGLPPDLVELCEGLLATAPDERPSGAAIQEVLVAPEARRAGGEVEETPISVVPVAQERPIIGRGAQLAELESAFRSSRRQQAISVYVHGPSGMGKTALIQHFLGSLSRHGSAVVLRGRCYEREMVPFKALDGVIDSLSRHLTSLAEGDVKELLPRDIHPLLRLFPVLRRVYPFSRVRRQRQDSPDLLTLRRRAFEALRELLGSLAERGPLVLFIDDLQWADADSTALLEDLLRPPDPPALVLLASFRSEEIDKQPFLQALLAHTGTETCRQLKIGALNDDEARELAASILTETKLSDPVLRAILKEAEGSPFLVEQLARYVQVESDALRTGLSLLEMLEERLRRLPAGARPLLLTMAVANRPLDAVVAYLAAGLEGDERSLVARLRTAHFVRSSGSAQRVELYHDRIRKALATLIDDAGRRRIHRRMAQVLEDRGLDDPEALFEHYLGAGDQANAARQAVLAAKKAFAALAFDPAARFYRRALELAPAESAQRLELKQGLAESLANAGRSVESAEAFLEVAESASVKALEARRNAAEQYLMGGHLEQGLAVARGVLAQVGLKMASGPRWALVSLLGNRLRLRLRGLRFKQRDEIAHQDKVRIDTCWAISNGLSLVDTVQGSDFQTRNLLLSLRAGEPYRIARALAMEVSFTAATGARKRAQQLQEKAAVLARKVDSDHAIGLATMQKGMIDYFSGDWKGAALAFDEAEGIFNDRCNGVVWELTICQRFSLSSLVYLGEMAELARRVPMSLAQARERGNTFLSKMVRSRLNIFWLAADDPIGGHREAAAVFAGSPGGGQVAGSPGGGQVAGSPGGEQVGQTEDPRGFTVNRYNALIAQIQADLYCDDARRAHRRLEENWQALERSLLLRVELARIETLQSRARIALALATGGGDTGPLLQIASRDAAEISAKKRAWANPLARLLRAGIAAVEGHDSSSRKLLRLAVEELDAADMSLYAAAARRRLGVATAGEQGRELVAQADAWMSEQRIVNPICMTAMLAPGFADA